ncbi:hypothetical protein GGI12_003484 [Dipsacomyces acuminosporus]|nr:hypothetical protein GGI12_003484 [Dipsacomyces acuminosporus]
MRSISSIIIATLLQLSSILCVQEAEAAATPKNDCRGHKDSDGNYRNRETSLSPGGGSQWGPCGEGGIWGDGPLGDRPESSPLLFPDRSGFNAGGTPKRKADGPSVYTPPLRYSANAKYASIKHGQVMEPDTFAPGAPTAYYASATRFVYPGSWGYGFYPIYPYPSWAYGNGSWDGATFYQHNANRGVKQYKSELRNITAVNSTGLLLIGEQDIFNNKADAGFVDFNNGTILIAPCGQPFNIKSQNTTSNCSLIVLDIKKGAVVRGKAEAFVESEITFFRLRLGNDTAIIRTITISNSRKSLRAGVITGIVFGCIGFVALVWLCVYWWKKSATATGALDSQKQGGHTGAFTKSNTVS